MADEKDRFGEKLRDKERGEEERYFAEQDRKRLEKLRAQAPTREVVLGLCPRCGVALSPRGDHGVTVDECPRCGGVWLDKGQLGDVVDGEDKGWARRWLRSVLGSR